jgi:FAD/FMN-containing dehydrogenase
VATATCEEDLRHILITVRAAGLPVSVQGAGHSCNGQSLVDGGVLIRNMAAGPQPIEWVGDHLVEISARSRWRQVDRTLARAGQRIPVLADYLDLSVGGTLSVGGYGVDSIAHGPQVDAVERLRLVMPDGSVLWCSQKENGEYFSYALGGLGQVGVIERAVLRTIDRERLTVLDTYQYEDLRQLIESFAWIEQSRVGRPQFFKALASRGRHLATYGQYAENLADALTAEPLDELRGHRQHHRLVHPCYRRGRSLAVDLWVRRFGRCQRIWSDFILDYPGLVRFGAYCADLLDREAFAGCLESIYILGIRRSEMAPDLPLEAASGARKGVKFLVGFYNMVPMENHDARAAVEAATALCLTKAIELGGRPYLYGWHRLGTARMKQIYGDGWRRLSSLRDELDPAGLFQSAKILSDS